MTPDLMHRICLAFTLGNPTVADREQIQKDAQTARSFTGLPLATRKLILKLEGLGKANNAPDA